MKHFKLVFKKKLTINKAEQKIINDSFVGFVEQYEKSKINLNILKGKVKNIIQSDVRMWEIIKLFFVFKVVLYEVLNGHDINNISINGEVLSKLIIEDINIYIKNNVIEFKPKNKITEKIIKLMDYGRLPGIVKGSIRLLPALNVYGKTINEFNVISKNFINSYL